MPTKDLFDNEFKYNFYCKVNKIFSRNVINVTICRRKYGGMPIFNVLWNYDLKRFQIVKTQIFW